MARSFIELPKYVKSIEIALAPALTEAHRRIAEEGVVAVTDATPVDTSKAVTNWQVSIGVPNTKEIPGKVPSVKGSLAKQARDIAASIGVTKLKTLQYMQTAFIANGVPYIGLLENGGPKHRANNMTSKAMQAMVAYAKTIKLNVNPRG